VAFLSVAAVTALIYPLKAEAPAVSTGVLYLLAVLGVSIFWGLRLGLVTSLLSAAAFNFFHIPPTGRFTIADEENWIALVTFLIAAAMASSLAELARARAAEAAQRTEEAELALRKLVEANRERDRLEAEAVEARALRRSDELKTALLRSVSHDLRSPLTAIVTSAEALRVGSIGAEDRTALIDAISSEGRRLSRLVENLIDQSRLEAGAADPRRDWSSIEEIARAAAVQACGPDGFRLAIDPDTPLIRIDAAQLERALFNVIENAHRHSGGEQVTVRARPVQDRLIVRVVDRGPGIPKESLDRVFEAFDRGNESDAAEAGSGLGLAIAKGFVEANGGQIWAESLPGQGTSIVIELPLEPVPAAVPEAAREART
jgi:two-component system sensor histidine kinase KdpD